jgi:SAM-dependent methyltransferase
MTTFKDHFSGHATGYAQSRPTYPPELFEWLASQCPRRDRAWDAGCGNGQAAVALTTHFGQVVASDPSAQQIAAATPHPRVHYRVEPAESPSLDDGSVDLITVAQAFHWFDHARFQAQVRRVAAPHGIVAVWTYGLSRVTPEVDAIYGELYEQRLGAWWQPERRDVENGYRDLPFPFEAIHAPGFSMTLEWTLDQYLAYLRTWSASQKHLLETGIDAVHGIAPAMMRAWGAAGRRRTVTWPLALRAGRVV